MTDASPLPEGLEELGGSDPREVGPYVLFGRLGAGAMGRVYLARPRAGGDFIALKVVRAEFADQAVYRRRFAREVEAARRVTGTRTAAVVDADPDAEFPWVATEWVAGPSLSAAVEAEGPWPSPRVRELAVGIAEALAAIHATGVVHRDLKPSNVLLGADGPKVIDFGVARAADTTQLTNTGQLAGTPAYMAPEQVDLAPAGPAADVFALGALLAFASSGRPAFGTGVPLAVLHRVVHSAPDLTGVAEDDAELRALIEGCLEKDPALRPDVGRVLAVCGPPADAVADCAGEEDGPASATAAGLLASAEYLVLSEDLETRDTSAEATHTATRPSIYVSPPDRTVPPSGPSGPSGPRPGARRTVPRKAVVGVGTALLAAATALVVALAVTSHSDTATVTATSRTSAPSTTVTTSDNLTQGAVFPSASDSSTGTPSATAPPPSQPSTSVLAQQQPLPTTPTSQNTPKPSTSTPVQATSTTQSAPRPSPTITLPPPPPITQPGHVTPALLGAPDFAGYCQATNQGTLTQVDNTAYGYRCSTPSATGLDAENVCKWTYKTSQITNRVADFNNIQSWQCWAANGMLGTPDFNQYCKSKGYSRGYLDPARNNVYGWYCDNNGAPVVIDSQDACLKLFGSNPPISRFQNYYDPNSWQCWG